MGKKNEYNEIDPRQNMEGRGKGIHVLSNQTEKMEDMSMNEKTVKQILMEDKLVAIFRGVPTEKAAAVAEALLAGGIRFFEVCLDQSRPDVWEVFREQFNAVKAVVGDKGYVGAGTVLTLEDVEMAAEAGCQLIVSPCTDENMIRRTKELGLLSIPGAMTPTEINRAYIAGADLVKMYVVEDPHYIQMLKGPLGHIPMQVTCNVSPETIPQFMAFGVKAFGTKAMLPDTLVAAGDYAAITEKAKAFVAAARRAG